MFTGSLSDGTTTIALFDPLTEWENVAAHGTPLASPLSNPTDLPLHLANSFAVPLNDTGRGWVLCLRSDLDALDLNARMSLAFVSDSPVETTLTWKNLVVAREPQVVCPAHTADDPDGVCLVELADARHLCNHSCNKQYNVPAHSYRGATTVTGYLVSSLNAGSFWTWSTMAGDLWALMSTQLGTFPGLPWTPDGTPEGWIFHGATAMDALKCVLLRIGCAIKADLTQAAGSQFTITRIGVADTTLDDALTAADDADRNIHDAEFQSITLGDTPYGVRVHFHRQDKYGSVEQATRRDAKNWQSLSVYTVDIVGPDSATAEAGVYFPIWDDLQAIYNPDETLSNGAALTTRAQERSDDFYRMLRSPGGNRLWKRYSGLLAIVPGSTLKGAAWRQHGDGCYTEIVNHAELACVANDGQFTKHSTKLQPPSFRPSFPIWPGRAHIIEIANGTPSGIYYDATITIRDNISPTWITQESVYAVDLRGATALTAGDEYLAIHIGYENSRPLYAIQSRPPSGTYTPTPTAVANLSIFSATDAMYFRIGNVVHVSGQVSAEPTATATLTQGALSIPIASNFTNSQDLNGVCFGQAAISEGAAIYADTANDRAIIEWNAPVGGNGKMNYTYTYLVK